MIRYGTQARRRVVKRASQRHEQELYREGFTCVAGLDEVGRGAWAGPVVAGAVILPRTFRVPHMFDSKKLSEMQREQLRNEIVASAVSYAVGEASVAEIHKLGVAGALRLAYVRALKKLRPQPDIVLLDGLPLKHFEYRHRAIIDGDQKAKCVAAASIVAKQYRDALMIKLAPTYPRYGFQLHKGYGTERHQRAILRHGILPIHRMRYGWLRDWQAGKRPQTQAARRYFASTSVALAEPTSA